MPSIPIPVAAPETVAPAPAPIRATAVAFVPPAIEATSSAPAAPAPAMAICRYLSAAVKLAVALVKVVLDELIAPSVTVRTPVMAHNPESRDDSTESAVSKYQIAGWTFWTKRTVHG